METSEIFSIIKNFSIYLIPAILMVLLFKKRSLIIHILWAKIFNTDFSLEDTDLKEAASNQLDIEKFQILFPNFKLFSIQQAKDLINWCKNYSVDMHEAHQHVECFGYTRIPERKILFSSPRHLKMEKNGNYIFAFLFFILTSASLAIPHISGLNGSVLVTGKHSGKLMWINKEKTLTGMLSTWKTTGSTCLPESPQSSEIAAEEHKALCNLIKDEAALEKYIENARKEGLLLFFIIFPMTLLLFYYCLSEANKKKKTESFVKYVADFDKQRDLREGNN